MLKENKAIKWFKGTVTGKTLYSKGNEGYKDFEVALRMAKKEVFDELDNVRITIDGTVKLETFFDYKDLKKKHLGEKH